MQSRNLILVGVALVLGLIAVVLANAYFSGVEEKQAQVAQEQRLARVVVASQPLEFGTQLTPQNLKLVNWPAQSVPEGAFLAIPDALRDNRVALRPMVPGEPVLASKVSGTDGRATLAALLPDGMRAVSFAIDNVSGVAGFVLPGTMVDIMLVRQIEGAGASAQDQRADMLLENVQVLAIDQLANDKDGNPHPGGVATVALAPRDAQKIAIAAKLGTLQLALRKVEPAVASADGSPQPRVASTLTSRQLGLPRIVIGGRGGGGGGGSSGGGGGGSFQAAPPPVLASISPPRVSTAPAVPVYIGPAMTVVRGTEPTSYQVGSLGGGR